MLPRIANAVEELRATNGAREDDGPEVELSIAGPTYLLADLIPGIAYSLSRARVRALEMPPAILRAQIAENVFDVAVVPGGVQSRPASWICEPVGELRLVLLGRPTLARKLGAAALSLDRVRTLPFIGPTQTGGERFVPASDDCPLRTEERHIAHEVQTIGAALEFAARSEYVVFGPMLAARRYIDAGALAEIPVAGWDVREPVYVACNGDRVLSKVRAAVLHAAREVLGSRATASFGLEERVG
jgi:DNA-binding transcriptional LysR family regulator